MTDAMPIPDAPPPAGLRCRKCNCTDLRVTDTRKKEDGRIRRRRVCRHCGTVLYTAEVPSSELAKRKSD